MYRIAFLAYNAAQFLLYPSVTLAAGLTAVQPLPGYACMMLQPPNAASPVLQAPSASAPRLGTASATMIVTSPAQTMNGYVKVLHLDGRVGWLDASKLRPWRSASDPSATCTPSIMSDGRPGTR